MTLLTDSSWTPTIPPPDGSITIEFFPDPLDGTARPSVTYPFADIRSWTHTEKFVVVWLDDHLRAQYPVGNVRNVLLQLNSPAHVQGLDRHREILRTIPADTLYRLETYDRDAGLVMYHIAESLPVAEELRAAHIESGWTVAVFTRIGQHNQPEDWVEIEFNAEEKA